MKIIGIFSDISDVRLKTAEKSLYNNKLIGKPGHTIADK